MSTLIIDRIICSQIILFRAVLDCFKGSRRDVRARDPIFIRTRLIFHCTEFARFISADKFVKRSCRRIVECPGNSDTENAKDVGHKKKGKNISPTVVAWRESNRCNSFWLAASAAPLARKENVPRLRRIIAIYGRRTLSRNYSAFNLSAIFPSFPIRLALRLIRERIISHGARP